MRIGTQQVGILQQSMIISMSSPTCMIV